MQYRLHNPTPGCTPGEQQWHLSKQARAEKGGRQNLAAASATTGVSQANMNRPMPLPISGASSEPDPTRTHALRVASRI